jgi:hypothetical protein
MLSLTALALVVLAADPSESTEGWEVAKKTDSLTVFARERKGSRVKEMRAEGVIAAPPEKVWKAIRDYESYAETMPYTEVARVLSREDGGKVTYLYSVINAPLVDRRDYVIRLVDESKWADGQGFLRVTWTPANDRGPPKPDNVVRVEVNEGYWHLEPAEGGKKTRAVYYVYTNPGGSVPRWLVNRANSSAVPDVFEHVRKAALKQ